MKKQNSKIILGVVIAVGLLVSVVATQVSFAQRSWEDEQVEAQNNDWEQEIAKWEKIHKEWSDKREQLHDDIAEDYDSSAKYCDTNNNCYEESLLSMHITRADGSYMKFDTTSNDVNGNESLSLGEFSNGDKWRCSNGGQALTFQGRDGTHWDSSNFGQVIIFEDGKGNKWESSNTGQVITFTGANGEKWEVSNNGQVVEHTDSSGKTWDGSDNDNLDDMRWRN